MRHLLVASSLLSACAGVACGGGAEAVGVRVTPGGSLDPSKWPKDDRSMCQAAGKPELDVVETLGAGSPKPNIRRVFKMTGDAENRRKTLICREVDTNLDGIKDVARFYGARGEPIREDVDRDYDGKIDEWITFSEGRIATKEIDTNKDGKADVWNFYVEGQLQRARRDRNFDGRPDVWEMYAKGELERIGIDEDYDGQIDRWDRDELGKAESEAAEKRARDAMEAAKAKSIDGGAGSSGPIDSVDAGK